MRSLRSILLIVGFVTLAAACHKKNASTTPTGENKSEVGTGGETYGTGEGTGEENPCAMPDEGMDPCGGGE